MDLKPAWISTPLLGAARAADGSPGSRTRFVPARKTGPRCFRGRTLQSSCVNPRREVLNLRVRYPDQHGVNLSAGLQGPRKGTLGLPGQRAETGGSTAGLCRTCPRRQDELASNPAPELGLIPPASPPRSSQRHKATDGALSVPPYRWACASSQFPNPVKRGRSLKPWKRGLVCRGRGPRCPPARGCQPLAPAAAASPCPAAAPAPCQQMGSRRPDVAAGKSCQGLLAGVSFSPVRLDIFSV